MIVLLSINAVMFLAEFVLGWLAQSTGLIADSLDMLADATVYGISLYAVGKGLGQKAKAARLSGFFQILLGVAVFVEVLRRLFFGSEPQSVWMMGVGGAALVANVVCLVLISKHRTGGVHMRASWIFSRNDVLANLGVIVSGLLVALLGNRFPDLIVGTIIALIVVRGGLTILQEAQKAEESAACAVMSGELGAVFSRGID